MLHEHPLVLEVNAVPPQWVDGRLENFNLVDLFPEEALELDVLQLRGCCDDSIQGHQLVIELVNCRPLALLWLDQEIVVNSLLLLLIRHLLFLFTVRVFRRSRQKTVFDFLELDIVVQIHDGFPSLPS